MNEYYLQSIRALQLAGMSERTQECYTRAVRMVADFYEKIPDQIAEPELDIGFRIAEALALQVSDIDGKRMQIHVHRML